MFLKELIEEDNLKEMVPRIEEEFKMISEIDIRDFPRKDDIYCVDELSEDGEAHVTNEYSVLKIFQNFWEYWSFRMAKLQRSQLISLENCLQDWAVINWAFLKKDKNND